MTTLHNNLWEWIINQSLCMPCWFTPPDAMLLSVGKFETQFSFKTIHTSEKSWGVQNQTCRQELLIFISMYTICQACVKDGGYFQYLLYYVVKLYCTHATQRVVNGSSKWDSQSHVHPAEKMVNTKGVPQVSYENCEFFQSQNQAVSRNSSRYRFPCR